MNRKNIGIAVLTLLIFGLSACVSRSNTVSATVLRFTEKDQQTEPYPVRMLVTRDFLRIDDGADSKDFLLFDRKDRLIYNTTVSDRSILVIPEQLITVKPSFTLTNKLVSDQSSLPKVEGKSVKEYRLFTNGELCYHIFTVDNLLTDAATALAEYRDVLAGEQARALAAIPIEMQTPCDLANNIFFPTRQLLQGFPIHQWDVTGRLRQLVDYRSEKVKQELFELPADYSRYTTQNLR